MKRDLALGVCVLALLGAGVFWARWQGSPDAEGSKGTTRQDDAATPDVTHADAVVDLDDARVVLSIPTRPVVAFTKTGYRVRIEARSEATPPGFEPTEAPTRRGARWLENGRLSFEMTMPMGDHRYSLREAGGGWYEADVVLPFCPSGNPRWYATVEGTVNGKPFAARFRLDLVKPAAAP
jgi:hypothetical protein